MIEKIDCRTFKTKTGSIIQVRSLAAKDAPYLVDIFENMGSESRYSRFLQPTDQVGMDRIWKEAENIAYQAILPNYGLVAFADLEDHADAPVGAARYVKISSQQAEIAVSVRDDMQNQGIGAHLLHLLIQHAIDDDIDQLVGTVQNGNTLMWAMLKKLGYRLERQSEGSYSLITLHLHELNSRTEDWLDTAADYSPEPQIIW